MSNLRKEAFWWPIMIGIVLIVYGFSIRVPGGALTTLSFLDGEATDSDYYYFDDRYSTIDEYVGGDAYNYIIGANLVAGKTSGAMAAKAIYIAVGSLTVALGATGMTLSKKKSVPMAAAVSDMGEQEDVRENRF